MKQLREILSKTASAATSAENSDTSSTGAEVDPSLLDDTPDDACRECGGAGFLRRVRSIDDPLFGRVEPCSCRLQEEASDRLDRLQRISNLGSLTRFTFATLRDAGPAFGSAVEDLEAYAAEPRGWLLLTGPSGSGKTHLAAAIANARIAAGKPALFMVAADLLDRLRAGFDTEDEDLTFERVFDHVRNAPLLLLDDIDTISPTGWAREKLFQVINHRFNLALPTVITSSTPPSGLDDRLASRLLDSAAARVITLHAGERDLYHQVGGMTLTRLQQQQFRDFDLRGVGLDPEERESLEIAFRAAYSFAEAPRGWLVLQGANGCGKTHLAAAIAARALADRMSVYFAVVPDLLDELRSGFAPGKDVGFDELFDRVRQAPLLILDDLGAQRSASWAEEKLYQIVNYRTMAGLPGVITTDRSVRELQAAFPRIVARVTDPMNGNMVAILAPHYRLGRLSGGTPAGGRHRRDSSRSGSSRGFE